VSVHRLSALDARAQELVQRASQGDGGAVEELLARYLPDLEGYVARHASPLVRARESAGDLAHSVCREVLESLRGGRFVFQGEAPFRQWLYRAAVMKLATRHRHWRALRRDPEREAGADSRAPSEVAAHDDRTPSLEAIAHEELARFQAAFESLSERHQQVIALHHLEALDHAAIGERLGISEANSRMLLSRALGRLARLLTQHGA
jgi:RNA polymerase sigma factor (sigma-70 family)